MTGIRFFYMWTWFFFAIGIFLKRVEGGRGGGFTQLMISKKINHIYYPNPCVISSELLFYILTVSIYVYPPILLGLIQRQLIYILSDVIKSVYII